MNPKRGLALAVAVALVIGAGCSASLWMDAMGKVSGWTGLPQYQDEIPKLRMFAMVWGPLSIALISIAAFVLGLGKRKPTDENSPAWSTVVYNYLLRFGLCTIGAIGFIFLLGSVVGRSLFH
jgi:hypothetical protein